MEIAPLVFIEAVIQIILKQDVLEPKMGQPLLTYSLACLRSALNDAACPTWPDDLFILQLQ